MTIEQILKQARTTWGDTPMTLDHITAALGVIYGDLCRQTRATHEGEQIDSNELQKELGNIIVSTVRWCDDLGLDPTTCIQLSQKAQTRYVERSTS